LYVRLFAENFIENKQFPINTLNIRTCRAMEEIRTIYKDLDRPENVILDVHGGGHVIDLPGLIYFFEKHLYQNRWKQAENPGL